MAFELQAYLRRIGVEAPGAPDLALLRTVVARHAGAIPFENIDVLLRRGVRIDLPSVADKLVARGRGGYCFEHATLLRAGLEGLGFRCRHLMARVVRGQAPDAMAPRSHLVVEVDLPGGPFLADTGFGNLTPTAPVGFATAEPQSTPHETYRLVPMGPESLLEVRIGGAWEPLYRIQPDEPPWIDQEMANWFTATHPGSPFVASLIVARPGDGVRGTLLNGREAERASGTPDTRVRTLGGAADLAASLRGAFGLRVPDADVEALAAVALGAGDSSGGAFRF